MDRLKDKKNKRYFRYFIKIEFIGEFLTSQEEIWNLRFGQT